LASQGEVYSKTGINEAKKKSNRKRARERGSALQMSFMCGAGDPEIEGFRSGTN
jgi:hypothetical protein